MTARTLKRFAATALMLTLVCLTTAGARQQQNPNSAGSGNAPSADRPADASKSAGKSEAQSAQKSQDEASTNERGAGNTNPSRRPKPRRRGHHN